MVSAGLLRDSKHREGLSRPGPLSSVQACLPVSHGRARARTQAFRIWDWQVQFFMAKPDKAMNSASGGCTSAASILAKVFGTRAYYFYIVFDF